MGFWGSVGSLIGSTINAVSSAIGSIGGALASTATSLLKVASPWLNTISTIIQIVSVLLDVLKPNDNLEELGAKAMEADKKPENFESNAEYIEYLRNEVTLDKEKFEKAGEAEKNARTAVGIGIVAKGIEEKKGFDIPMTTWVALAKLDLTDKAKEIDTILDTFKNGKLEDFVKYTEGKLDTKKEIEIGDTLVEMYKELEPNMSDKEIESKVMNMEVGDKPHGK